MRTPGRSWRHSKRCQSSGSCRRRLTTTASTSGLATRPTWLLGTSMFSAIAGSGGLVHRAAGPPGDAVGLRPDGGGRHGHRLPQLLDDVAGPVRHAVAGPGSLEHGRRAGPLALGPPRRAEADDLPYAVGVLVRDAPGQQAAEAPADDRHRLVVAIGDLDEPVDQAVDQPVGEADVASEPPAVDVEAVLPQVRAQPTGQEVVGCESGKHEHGSSLADAARRPDGVQDAGGGVLTDPPGELQCRQQGRRWACSRGGGLLALEVVQRDAPERLETRTRSSMPCRGMRRPVAGRTSTLLTDVDSDHRMW